ncbi:tetraspanin [Irpex lacteus]|nr:tetraspanin [Irpex lacteus]
MVSKRILGFYGFVQLWLLAAAALSIAMSIVWKAPNLMINFTFHDIDLTAGLVLGIFLIVTFFISVFAVLQKNHVTIGLVILNWTLIADSVVVLVVGTIIWFYSLHQRQNYFEVFKASSPQTRIEIQDKFKCCGYFAFNDTTMETSSGFCSDPTVANRFNFSTPEQFACVGPINSFTDFTLNNTFTTIYGYMAILIALFLASLCIIHQRVETERFRKIDAKRGGRGFV